MGKNDKGGSLKIPDKAVRILKHYEQFRKNNDDFVFPELKGVDTNDDFITQRMIAFKTSALDKTLRLYVAPAAQIYKNLTMHISRHTFGRMAGDIIPIQMLQNFIGILMYLQQLDINLTLFTRKQMTLWTQLSIKLESLSMNKFTIIGT